MSNTQQEIATPKKVCKQRTRAIVLAVLALLFVCIAAVCCVFMWDNPTNVSFVFVALMIVLAVLAIAAVKENRVAVKVILDVLTAAVALIIIGRLLLATDKSGALVRPTLGTYLQMALTAVIAIALDCLDIVSFFYKKGTRFSTRYITYAATFVALSILFKMLGNAISVAVTTNMKLTFIYIPWLLAGIVLGPVGGTLTALISDVIGQLIVATGGAVNPLTTLSNALFPLATSLLFLFAKKWRDWIKLGLGTLISIVVCTLGIGSYAIYTMYGYNETMNFFVYVWTFRMFQALTVVINYVLCLLLLPVVKRMRLPERLREQAG